MTLVLQNHAARLMRRPTRHDSGIADSLIPNHADMSFHIIKGVWVVEIWAKGVDLRDRLMDWFVDREFFMRSNGQVRFLKISAKLQRRVAGGIAAVIGIWLVITLGMAVNQVSISFERMALTRQEAKVQSAAERVATYRDSIDDVTKQLSQRQDVLDSLSNQYMPDAAAKAAAPAAAAQDETVEKISAAIPEAAGLARIEGRQLAFAERLTVIANVRAQRAASAIRKLGLNPESLANGKNETAMGGPFIPFFSKAKDNSKDNLGDPRFGKLANALQRMSAMEQALASMPTTMPASQMLMSSGFGYRHDPFTGAGAMHSGLDFKGPIGTPILAAADGQVTFAGVQSGYGNCIEITHSNGLITRYAHLSGFTVSLGQQVKRGVQVAQMGSTGRSTGSHLHFEVRLNGSAINPRTFLESNTDVFEVQTAARNPAINPLAKAQ
jgi:murein DD-endopeptidase MepM/ murein hydrolase activator NlpD